jgi:hypothetical protein
MAREERQVLGAEAVFSAEVIPDGRVRLAVEYLHGEAAVALPAEDAERIAHAILDLVESAAKPPPPPPPTTTTTTRRKSKGGS